MIENEEFTLKIAGFSELLFGKKVLIVADEVLLSYWSHEYPVIVVNSYGRAWDCNGPLQQFVLHKDPSGDKVKVFAQMIQEAISIEMNRSVKTLVYFDNAFELRKYKFLSNIIDQCVSYGRKCGLTTCLLNA
jgi:hypothetical protein